MKSRTQTWLALIVVAVGLLVAAILGIWGYVSNTPPLHPNPQDVPSVTHSAPSPIGTASTALTSAAVGLLLEKDRLRLDEKIQTYVPEFPEKQKPVPVIDTLEQRFSATRHERAGMARDTAPVDGASGRRQKRQR